MSPVSLLIRSPGKRLRPGGSVFAPALAELAAAALLLSGVEVVLLVDSGFKPLWVVLLFPGYALLYVATGLFAWARRPSNSMGALIVVGGFPGTRPAAAPRIGQARFTSPSLTGPPFRRQAVSVADAPGGTMG